jgi:AAA family ATP:ADP antiporter
LFWCLYRAGVPIGVPFYLWLGIFNMMVIAQFWSLASELFTREQGTRLFAIIAFGGTIGAIAGARLAESLIAPLGLSSLMLLAAVLLVACIGLTTLGARMARRARTETKEDLAFVPEKPLAKVGGFKLVMSVKYLRLIALMIIVYNLVNTTGEYILGSMVTERATAEAAGNHELAKQLVGQFYGNYFTWVNAIAAILQAFLVSRIVRFVGVRVALLLLPAIALGGYGMIATVPILMWIKIAKITENSVDYSLHNTVRQMLWLPTTTEAKYKAKAAIDTFFVRFGDVLAAGVVWGGTQLALSPRMFAAVNVVGVIVWGCMAFAVGREHQRLVKTAPGEPATQEQRAAA